MNLYKNLSKAKVILLQNNLTDFLRNFASFPCVYSGCPRLHFTVRSFDEKFAAGIEKMNSANRKIYSENA